MQNLRVSIVQGDTRWHDPAGNRDYYGHLIAPLHSTTAVSYTHLDVYKRQAQCRRGITSIR